MISDFNLISFKSIIFCSIALHLFACGSNQVLDVNTDHRLIILDDLEAIRYDELFNSVTQEIKFESGKNIMLGDDLSFYFYKDEIYVLDKSQVKLLRFKENGDFVNEIGKAGRGPGELPEINSFYVDNEGITSISTAGSITKIFKHRPDGSYLKSLTLNDFVAIDIEKFDGKYLLYTGFNKFVHKHRLIQLDTGLNKVGAFLRNDYKGEVIPLSEKSLLKTDDKLFLKESLNQVIYELSGEDIIPVYQFDFGSNTIPDEYWDIGGIKGYELMLKQGVAYIRYFFQNNDYAFVVVVVQQENRETKLHFIIHDKFNDICKMAIVIAESESMNYKTPIGITRDNEMMFLGFPELDTDASNDIVVENPSIKFYKIGN